LGSTRKVRRNRPDSRCSSAGCAARSFPHSPGPCSPTRITTPPSRTSNPPRKATRVPGRASNTSASLATPRGKTAAAPSNQDRPVLLRVRHPRLQPIIAFLITVCCTAPPPVFHLPKHLPFRNTDTRSLETALSPNLRLPDPFDQRGVRSLFASMSRSLLIC